MQTRHVLRAQLARAWETTIREKYVGQLINSEHGLQTYFCAALLQEFQASKTARRLFIEPRLRFSDGSAGRHPDVVICNTKSIVGLVEIKYVPRGKPTYEKDLETLRLAVANAETLTISNDRFRGVTSDNRPYPLARDAVLCWAGVYAGTAVDLRAKISDQSLASRFLQLNALTTADEDPKIVRL